jgi:hypothetical protein
MPHATSEFLYQVAFGKKKVILSFVKGFPKLLRLDENVRMDLKNYTLTEELSKISLLKYCKAEEEISRYPLITLI